MKTLDLKNQWGQLYKPAAKGVSFVEVPPLRFLMADGAGDPNGSASFQEAVQALYALSYALKFIVKQGPRQIDYGVLPLEGLWWADDPIDFERMKKSVWKWTLMIAQPDFITAEEVAAAREEVRRKKKDAGLERVRLESFTEGLSAQVLYKGPYFGEGPTIERLHAAIHEAGKELRGKHHEIYLNDARRTAPEKLKTILRQPVE